MFSHKVNSWPQTRIEAPVSISPCYRSFSCFWMWRHRWNMMTKVMVCVTMYSVTDIHITNIDNAAL